MIFSGIEYSMDPLGSPWLLTPTPPAFLFTEKNIEDWKSNKYNWIRKILEKMLKEKFSHFTFNFPFIKKRLPDIHLELIIKFQHKLKIPCIEIYYDPFEDLSNNFFVNSIKWNEAPSCLYDRDQIKRSIALAINTACKKDMTSKKFKYLEEMAKKITTSCL